jgi:hypothetical protein
MKTRLDAREKSKQPVNVDGICFFIFSDSNFRAIKEHKSKYLWLQETII